MSNEKHDSSKHCKSHHVQRAGLEETKVLAERGASIPQRHPLMQQISRMATIPNPGAHAAILNRTPDNQLSSNRQLLLQLQRQYGNSYVQQVMQQMSHPKKLLPLASTQQPLVQAKLTIGEPRDKYELEADKVAQQVVQQINAPASVQSAQSQNVQRQAKEEDELQMKPVVQRQANTEMAVAPDLEASINQARGGGQPLADNIREPMEQAFRADFSGVRVHTDAQADQLNQSIQAKAFTTGEDVFFRQGEYIPGSRGGQELIAHELAHVVQQKPIISSVSGIDYQGVKSLAEKHTTENKVQRMNGGNVLPGNRQLIKQFVEWIKEWMESKQDQIEHLYNQPGGWEGWCQGELSYKAKQLSEAALREGRVYDNGALRADFVLLSNEGGVAVELKCESFHQKAGFAAAVNQDTNKLANLPPNYFPMQIVIYKDVDIRLGDLKYTTNNGFKLRVLTFSGV